MPVDEISGFRARISGIRNKLNKHVKNTENSRIGDMVTLSVSIRELRFLAEAMECFYKQIVKENRSK